MCDCVEDIVKYFLFVTNLILFLLSTVVLGLTIWILADEPSFLSVLGQANIDFPVYSSAAVLLLVVSIFVIFITFFGCCGASKENRCMLATYFVLVLLLLIGLAVGAFMAFSGNMDTLKDPFIQSLKKYDDTSAVSTDKALVEAWNAFQQDFKCCGVDSYSDWMKYNENFLNAVPYGSKRKVPESCCDPNQSVGLCVSTAESIYGLWAEGCFTMVLDEINSHSGIIGGVAIAVVVIMILNCLISLYLVTCGHYSGDRHMNRPYGRAPTRA